MPKRDLDEIRRILLRAEAEPLDVEDDLNSGFHDWGGLSPSEGFHLGLMRDAGLVEGKDASIGFFRVTHAGYEYLDAIRNEGIWNKTKAIAAEQGGSLALELVKQVATALLRNQLEKLVGSPL